jgi:hypothetical protein
MEGFYRKGRKPRILLSALRPLVRRTFNCAHEIGHWSFGHGSTLDALLDDRDRTNADPDELLVDMFGGFLLMPPLGVRRSLARRKWRADSLSPLQAYILACSYGVGYETFVEHASRSLRLIPMPDAERLLKSSPIQIRELLLGRRTPEPLVIVDPFWELRTIDVEEGTLVGLPSDTTVDGNVLQHVADVPAIGRLYRAVRTGIGRVVCDSRSWAAFTRVTRFQFVGLSSNRHLEDLDDEE